METEKKQKQAKYFTGIINLNKYSVDYALQDLDERLSEIEMRVFKTERKNVTTRAQQMLLLKELGILEKLNEHKVSNKKISSLLSVLLNASQSNIEDDLSSINKAKSHLMKANNYKILANTFKDSGLKELQAQADIMFDKLSKEENK